MFGAPDIKSARYGIRFGNDKSLTFGDFASGSIALAWARAECSGEPYALVAL